MSKVKKPRSRKENIVVQDVDGETLIYDLEKNKALCLNHTSALVWQACDGKRTIAEITDLIGRRLQAQADEDIVWLALDQLSKERLIDPPVDLRSKFEGMSRREVIKKIGLGSMIALPMVASLVAPTAVHAQSAQPLASGAVSGVVTISGSCLDAGQGTRDVACATETGSLCISGVATQKLSPDDCVANPGAGATFSCVCL